MRPASGAWPRRRRCGSGAWARTSRRGRAGDSRARCGRVHRHQPSRVARAVSSTGWAWHARHGRAPGRHSSGEWACLHRGAGGGRAGVHDIHAGGTGGQIVDTLIWAYLSPYLQGIGQIHTHFTPPQVTPQSGLWLRGTARGTPCSSWHTDAAQSPVPMRGWPIAGGGIP